MSCAVVCKCISIGKDNPPDYESARLHQGVNQPEDIPTAVSNAVAQHTPFG